MTLNKKLLEKVSKDLQKKLWKKNIYQVPRITKITINSWVWTYIARWAWRNISDVVDNITNISGQKAIVIKAKLSVSNFKLRKWMSAWVKVTLRWDKMYWFIDKMTNIVFPRVRDFQWISKKLDKMWNYSIWLKDVSVFPEISLDDIWKTHWIQINFSIDTESKEDSFELLKTLNLPFKK